MKPYAWLVPTALFFCIGCESPLTPGGTLCEPACPTGQTCQDGLCIATDGAMSVPCRGDSDCQDDTYCQSQVCVPYGTLPRGAANGACSRVVPAGLLAPQIFCEWTGPEAGDPFPSHVQVLSTPLVADFNFDGHKSSEFPTIRPSIVVNTYDGLDGACGLGPAGNGANFGVLRILDGRTCKQQFVIQTHVNGASTPALGDINGDGKLDIVAASATGGLVALSFNGTQFAPLWTSHTGTSTPHNPLAGLCEWVGPSLADLDDDGKPEALMEGFVYDSTGALVDGTLGSLSAPLGDGQYAVVADIDRDGAPDLLTTRYFQRWDKTNRRWSQTRALTGNRGFNDFVAVGDFGTVSGTTLDRKTLDGVAEVVVISNGKAAIWSAAGQIVFGPITLPGSTGGGPPTVGDFDHDGRAEFAAAGSDSYSVFDPDCVPGGDAKHCPTAATGGILWTSQSQDRSSNITGSSVFDFEGDGSAEAVYADECYARIYNGSTGQVLFSQPHSSCTWTEYPVVADVAGDFRSKLIVPSNKNCSVVCPTVDPVFQGLRCQTAADCPGGVACDAGLCRCTTDAQCNNGSVGGGFVCQAAPTGTPGTGKTCRASNNGTRSGIRVFGDVLDRWASSRPLWSEHTYSITNINDDGTIPRTSQRKRNWEQPGLNNYRMNLQGGAGPQPAVDLTSRAQGTGSCAGSTISVSAQVCNRGSAPVGDGVPVSFYEGGKVACTGKTAAALSPGMCMAVTCQYTAAGSATGDHALTVATDDDGTGAGKTSECEKGNNKATLKFSCP